MFHLRLKKVKLKHIFFQHIQQLLNWRSPLAKYLTTSNPFYCGWSQNIHKYKKQQQYLCEVDEYKPQVPTGNVSYAP